MPLIIFGAGAAAGLLGGLWGSGAIDDAAKLGRYALAAGALYVAHRAGLLRAAADALR